MRTAVRALDQACEAPIMASNRRSPSFTMRPPCAAASRRARAPSAGPCFTSLSQGLFWRCSLGPRLSFSRAERRGSPVPVIPARPERRISSRPPGEFPCRRRWVRPREALLRVKLRRAQLGGEVPPRRRLPATARGKSQGRGVQMTFSTLPAPVASITTRSAPSAMPLACGICARAARKSSSIG